MRVPGRMSDGFFSQSRIQSGCSRSGAMRRSGARFDGRLILRNRRRARGTAGTSAARTAPCRAAGRCRRVRTTRASGTARSCSRSRRSSWITPFRLLIVEAERRHPHVEPRPDRDRAAEERVEPVGLHARAFRRQQRRTERRIGDELQEVAAVAFDDVAADAVAPVHERAARRPGSRSAPIAPAAPPAAESRAGSS